MGIAADGQGHLWMVDRENNRVVEFDEEGKYLGQFGSKGTANGQFLDPRGIALAPNGTIWVADAARGRIQQFNVKGEYLQGFGAKVSAPNSDPYSFVEPWGVAIAPNGRLWVSDAGGGRIALFNEQYVPGGTERFVLNAVGTPSGSTAKAELTAPVGIATDASGNVWVAENGAHRVSVFDSSGKFRMRFGSEGSGNGQFKNPVAVAITPTNHVLVTDGLNNRVQEFMSSGAYIRQFGSEGSANNQLREPRGVAVGAGNVAFVADAGNHRVARWTGVDLDPQSGAVSTEVKVDGNLVEPKYAPGCATKNCSISREWKLRASDYSSGQHQVQVVATDGVGLTTTKELTVTTDNAVPQLKTISSYFLTPKGWLEQKTYSYSTSFSDAGYGVTSIAYKIDGKVVNNVNQSCPSGGCSVTLAGTINMAAYDGGAHAAELVATDAAGNVKTFSKTINVDPKGNIPVVESVDTLEALEETSSTNAVGESQEEEIIGSAPGLGLESQGNEITATGSKVPLTVGDTAEEGITLEVLADPEAESTPEVIPVMIEPVQTAEDATETTVVDGTAAVAADTGNHVDTVIRPLSDGGMTFQNIRDPLGPETFAWEVHLYPEQELKSIDSIHAGVYLGEHLIFSIDAIAAHDAIGTNVPTKLAVSSGNIVTLTVEHHAAAFVYPVIAGAGWEGGFITTYVEMPPPEANEDLAWMTNLEVGAPEVDDASISSTSGEHRKKFVAVHCGFHIERVEQPGPTPTNCGNPFREDRGDEAVFQVAIRGAFFYTPGKNVRHNDAIACAQWVGHSSISDYTIRPAYQCRYGPQTSDGNGGASAGGGHYLRGQAHWEYGVRGVCGDNCGGKPNPWIWWDQAMELHLWPSGDVQKTDTSHHEV
jgi:hypothetical protein